MLFRFSLYGFLKNQQYYDPFLILILRDKGLSFTAIGLLIGFRELCTNVMEVPSGVMADLWGRRRTMILSFAAYIVSFAVFGFSAGLGLLFAAMFFFAVGAAFRTGTHKAMILDWLRLQGREDEKTKTYGYTRSWSKMGSAAAVLIGAAIVVASGRYAYTFLFAIVPYLLGIVNFLGYPAELEGRPDRAPSLRNMLGHLWRAFRRAFGHGRLRRVLLESMGYEGTHKVTKDYLQPILKQLAVALPLAGLLGEARGTAIVVGTVYCVLYVGAGIASRHAHKFAGRFGGESRAARGLWAITLAVFVPVGLALWFGVYWLAAAGFVALALLQNLWRPITITRVDNETDATMGATMLSIESQAKALGAMILAPLLGLAVDSLAAGPEQPALWAVGGAGAAVARVGTRLPAMRPAPAALPAGAEQQPAG